jgi:WD40 repeat protein
VRAVCAVQVEGRQLPASASYDETVRIWDPSTGEDQRTHEGHACGVRAVCAVQIEGRQLLASGSQDRTVRIWDRATERCLLIILVHYEALALATALHKGLTDV